MGAAAAGARCSIGGRLASVQSRCRGATASLQGFKAFLNAA